MVEEVHLRPDLVRAHCFRTESRERLRAVIGTACAEASRIFRIKMDVRSRVDRGNDHRVDAALVVAENVIRRDTADGGQYALALVFGVTRAGGQVEDVEAAGGPGRLTEGRVAARAGVAVTLDEPGRAVPALVGRSDRGNHNLAVDRVAGAVRIPFVRAGRRRRLRHMLVEIISAD